MASGIGRIEIPKTSLLNRPSCCSPGLHVAAKNPKSQSWQLRVDLVDGGMLCGIYDSNCDASWTDVAGRGWYLVKVVWQLKVAPNRFVPPLRTGFCLIRSSNTCNRVAFLRWNVRVYMGFIAIRNRSKCGSELNGQGRID